MRPLIGLSINGLLKRSLLGRADERRGEMDEEGIGRHDAGAHGFSMGYNYNGRLRSAEILLQEDGTAKLIRRAETPKDYFATFDCFDFYKNLKFEK